MPASCGLCVHHSAVLHGSHAPCVTHVNDAYRPPVAIVQEAKQLEKLLEKMKKAPSSPEAVRCKPGSCGVVGDVYYRSRGAVVFRIWSFVSSNDAVAPAGGSVWQHLI